MYTSVVNQKTLKINRAYGKLLSNREYQCIKLLAHGKRLKEIANVLDLSVRTVEYYISNAKVKTGCLSHTLLVDYYWRYYERKEINL